MKSYHDFVRNQMLLAIALVLLELAKRHLDLPSNPEGTYAVRNLRNAIDGLRAIDKD